MKERTKRFSDHIYEPGMGGEELAFSSVTRSEPFVSTSLLAELLGNIRVNKRCSLCMTYALLVPQVVFLCVL